MFRALNGTDVRLHLPNGFADRLVAECRSQPKRSFFPALPRWALIAASLAIIAGFVFAAAVVGGAGTGSEGGRAKAQMLAEALSAQGFAWNGVARPLRASIGVRDWSGQDDAETWLAEADAAMWMVKPRS